MYGEECMIKTIENFTSIDINYYVKINFKGVVKIIDELDGIEVEVHIGLQIGKQISIVARQLASDPNVLQVFCAGEQGAAFIACRGSHLRHLGAGVHEGGDPACTQLLIRQCLGAGLKLLRFLLLFLGIQRYFPNSFSLIQKSKYNFLKAYPKPHKRPC